MASLMYVVIIAKSCLIETYPDRNELYTDSAWNMENSEEFSHFEQSFLS